MESGEIELRPLTVILGKNSAGKSSFIRLFPLLKQTLERKISDTLLWYGDYVDFGDFQNTISKQGVNDSIEISFSVMTYSRYIRYISGASMIKDIWMHRYRHQHFMKSWDITR